MLEFGKILIRVLAEPDRLLLEIVDAAYG